MKLNIVGNTPVWLTLSGIMIVASFVAFGLFGLRLSSDFTEGNLYEIKFNKEVVAQDLAKALVEFKDVELGNVEVKGTSLGALLFKSKRLSAEESDKVLNFLKKTYGDMDVIQNRSVSPVFAETFRTRAFHAILAASIMIVLYIAFAFRKVSRGVSSWKMGLCAIAGLLHNVIITVGVFVVLGKFFGVEIDALFITALLTVMGFSVHDTIVVFDRIRENILNKTRNESFADITEKSLHQTMARSINTSISTLIVLLAILLVGAPSIFWFCLALFIGIAIGTYASIFIASTLLVLWQRKS